MNCICQKVYDTGFTGIAKIDARLAHHYKVYGEDCIKRDFDHYNNNVPYSVDARSPYCFKNREKGECREYYTTQQGNTAWRVVSHTECEKARYRAPDTVKRMRHWIENTACKAAIHYPAMLEDNTVPEVVSYGGTDFKTFGTHKDGVLEGLPIFARRTRRVTDENGEYIGTLRCLQRNEVPANESGLAEREAWEDAMFRLHSRIVNRNPLRSPKGHLPATSIESFREYVAEAMYGVASMEMTPAHDEYDKDCQCESCKVLEAEARLGRKYDLFWAEGYGDWSDEELQAAYS